MTRFLIPLLFLALMLPGTAEAKSSHGASECAHFYVQIAQEEDVPHGVGHKVRWCHQF